MAERGLRSPPPSCPRRAGRGLLAPRPWTAVGPGEVSAPWCPIPVISTAGRDVRPSLADRVPLGRTGTAGRDGLARTGVRGDDQKRGDPSVRGSARCRESPALVSRARPPPIGLPRTVRTIEASVLRQVAARSLFAFDKGYNRLTDDSFAWRGTRPAGGWHIHGWTEAHPWAVVDGRRQRITVRKRRWRRDNRSVTCHSRPPDALRLRSDALLVVLELWCWLDAAVGLHRYVGPFADGPARRTVQRWLHRALPVAAATQHALRYAVIERSEPRPLEMLFPRGCRP